MPYETLIWERAGAVGRLTLNRPESLNAWTTQFGHELLDVITDEAADDARAGHAGHRRWPGLLLRRRSARRV